MAETRKFPQRTGRQIAKASVKRVKRIEESVFRISAQLKGRIRSMEADIKSLFAQIADLEEVITSTQNRSGKLHPEQPK